MFWKIQVPQKVKICAWKMLKKGLPTRQVKKSKHLDVVDECLRCGRGTEDSFHAVVACPTSSVVWDAMGEVWIVLAKETIRNTGDEWLFDLLVTIREEERAKVLMIVWRN